MAVSESYTKSEPVSNHNSQHKHHHIRLLQRQDVPSGDEDVGDEELDPRIQIELEKLNRASEEINRLELELDDARAAFRQVLSDSTQCLNGLAKKLGTCVDKARPYYDAKLRLREAQQESQKAVLMFERSCSMHEAAKEMVQLAEDGYKRRECSLAPTWQEMLNHATVKVNEAEKERTESEEYHQRATLRFQHTQEEVLKFQADLKKVITKSKVYFEVKTKFSQVLEEHKNSVSRLEDEVSSAKALYAQALCSLEAISDDIHRHRLEQGQKLLLGIREAGVGAESPLPCQEWTKGMKIEGSASAGIVGDEANECPINVLDVNQLKLHKHTGISYFEAASHRKTSPRDGILKTDALDPVVFKTSLSDIQTISCSQTFQPVFNHQIQADSVRTYSHQATGKTPNENYPLYLEADPGHRYIYPTPQRGTPEPGVSLKMAYQEFGDTSRGLLGKDESLSELVELQNVGPSPSDTNCHQQFANSSQALQHQSVTSSSQVVQHSPTEFQHPPTLVQHSPTQVQNPPTQVQNPLTQVQNAPTQVQNPPLDAQNSPTQIQHPPTQVHNTSTTAHQSPKQVCSPSTQHSPTPTQHPTIQHTPTPVPQPTHRKPPRLQGLILQVGANTASLSAAHLSVRPLLYPHSQQNSKVHISTHHPLLGIFMERPLQPRPPV